MQNIRGRWKAAVFAAAISVLVTEGAVKVANAAGWAAGQASSEHGAIKVAPEVMEKRCIKKVSPIFPERVRQARMQGTVTVSVMISRTGAVTPLEAVAGVPLLRDAAMSTVRKWEYRPYLVNGQPVAVSTEVKVIFILGAPEGVVTHPNA